MQWVISESDCPIAIREFLHRRHKVSSRLLSKLKRRDDGIVLNGQRVNVTVMLKPGDVLSIACEDISSETNEEIIPNDLPFSIVYEDSDIRVLSKPPFMPTHPSLGHPDDSLANAVAFYAQVHGEPFVFRPLSRLDRNTSGVILTARNQFAASELTRSMQSCLIHKTYLAILSGIPSVPPLEWQETEGFIARESESLITRRVASAGEDGAEYALTEWRIVALNEKMNVSLAEASPVTGRTHQLRVHFSSLGFPILGDTLYGPGSPLLNRQALHAYTVCFPHPVTHEILTVKAPVAEDMDTVLKELFPDQNY